MEDLHRCVFIVTICFMIFVTLRSDMTAESFCAPGALNNHTTMFIHSSSMLSHSNCKPTKYLPIMHVPFYRCTSTFPFVAVHRSLFRGLKRDLFVYIPSGHNVPDDWYTVIIETINRLNARLNVHAIVARE